MWRVPTSVYLLLFIALIVGNVFVYREIFTPPTLTVTPLPVERGRAFLVESPSGRVALIDTGRDASVLRALGAALPLWQRHISTVILTSVSADTVGGLPDVFARYEVPLLIRPKEEGSRHQEGNIARATKRVRVVIAHAGDRFSLGEGTYIEILSGNPFTLLLSYGEIAYTVDKQGAARTR